MKTKLWSDAVTQIEKGMPDVHTFTAGSDKQYDMLLAPHDIAGTKAHVKMLHAIGMLTKTELDSIIEELDKYLHQINNNEFVIEEEVEDVHSQLELLLTRNLGETGKKIHAGRSRNDQVLLALKLYLKSEIKQIAKNVSDLFDKLIGLSEKYKDVLLPGYTHMQTAMPSSFGLWFGAYAESLTEDLEWLLVAFNTCNRNPLGSAAGYGSSFPIDREFTTNEAGLQELHFNAVYAQMTRGKTEKTVTVALSAIAATLAKFAYDVCVYMMNEMKFIQFPDTLVTGSSIMPHKKNPDVFELIRAKCNLIQTTPATLGQLTGNLPSGYHRDFQLTKEVLFPAITSLKSCLEMTTGMLEHISVRKDILVNPVYATLMSVEAVNQKVMNGLSFRDAYTKVKKEIADGSFLFEGQPKHTHIGSMGNLCNNRVIEKFNSLYTKLI